MKITKELYLELKETGATDKEIANLLGITRRALTNRKRMWGITREQVERGETTREKDKGPSLCYSCLNSRPSRCAWVREGRRIFRDSKIVTMQIGKGQEQVELVTACEFFMPMGGLRMREKVEEVRT